MHDARVIGAMLRLARRREAADVEAIALRVGASESVVRASIRRLDSLGLVERRRGSPLRLTLEGLAVAVAMLPMQASPKPHTARSVRAA